MKKFDIPARPKQKYSEGERKILSIRLPESLLKRLNKEIKDKGYTQTELIELILDQYFQYSDDKKI